VASGLWRNGPGGSPMPACQAVWCQCMLYLASTYHIINAHPAVPLCHAGGGGPSCLARSSSLRRGAEIARSSHHRSHAAAGRGGVAVVVSGAGGAAVALGAARRRVGVGALRAAQARRLLVVVGVGPPRRAGAAPRRARRRVRAHPAVDARLRPASRASARPRYVSHHPLTDDDEEEDEEEDPAGTGTGTGGRAGLGEVAKAMVTVAGSWSASASPTEQSMQRSWPRAENCPASHFSHGVAACCEAASHASVSQRQPAGGLAATGTPAGDRQPPVQAALPGEPRYE
jgi:hypothetical protein